MAIRTRLDHTPEPSLKRHLAARLVDRLVQARTPALLAAATVAIGCAGSGTTRAVAAATDWPVIDRSAVTLPAGQESVLELSQVASETSAQTVMLEIDVDPGVTKFDLTGEMLETLREAEAEEKMLRLERLFRKGDRILFGLELDDEGDVERWTMELRIAAVVSNPTGEGSSIATGTFGQDDDQIEVRSRLYDGEISLWDASGALVGKTTVAVPHFVGEGLTPICLVLDELGSEARDNESPESSESSELPSDKRVLTAMGQSLMSVMGVLRIVDENELLAPILRQAVRTPSLFSLIGNFGIELNIHFTFDRRLRLEHPGPGTPWSALPEQPCFSLPATITANGEEALLIDFFVTTPTQPLATCGGVLAIVGRHPSRDLTFRMNVIGASRLEPDTEREDRGSQ